MSVVQYEFLFIFECPVLLFEFVDGIFVVTGLALFLHNILFLIIDDDFQDLFLLEEILDGFSLLLDLGAIEFNILDFVLFLLFEFIVSIHKPFLVRD